MIIISESCCGRQRASLKTVIHSRARLLYCRIRISVNKAAISLSFTRINSNISRAMDYFEFFNA